MKVSNVTSVVRHRVKGGVSAEYEEWLHRISKVAVKAKGYEGIHIIRPLQDGNEYTIVLRWASYDDGKNWAESDVRKDLLRESEPWQELPDHVEIDSGIDYWFAPEKNSAPKAPRWKQWVVTTSVIWPLSMLVQFLFQPLFLNIPLLGNWPLGPFLIVSITVWLATFGIMPRLVPRIAPWMFRD